MTAQQSKVVSTITRLMAHPLNKFYYRGALGAGVKMDTFGCGWTGEFDLITLRVGEEIFGSGRKSWGFKNIRIRVDGAQQ